MGKIRKCFRFTILFMCIFFLISCSKYPGKLNNEIEKEKTEVHRNESDRDSNYWTEEKMDKAEPPDIREK